MAKDENKYPIPNLENATDGGLVDVLASWKEQEKEAKFYSGFYRDQIALRFADRGRKNLEQKLTPTDDGWQKMNLMEGELFTLEVSSYDSERFDTTAFKADAEKDNKPLGDMTLADVYRKYLKSGVMETYRTKPVKK